MIYQKYQLTYLTIYDAFFFFWMNEWMYEIILQFIVQPRTNTIHFHWIEWDEMEWNKCVHIINKWGYLIDLIRRKRKRVWVNRDMFWHFYLAHLKFSLFNVWFFFVQFQTFKKNELNWLNLEMFKCSIRARQLWTELIQPD